MKNSSDTIGNRTRNLPGCSASVSTNCATAYPITSSSICTVYMRVYISLLWGVVVCTAVKIWINSVFLYYALHTNKWHNSLTCGNALAPKIWD